MMIITARDGWLWYNTCTPVGLLCFALLCYAMLCASHRARARSLLRTPNRATPPFFSLVLSLLLTPTLSTLPLPLPVSVLRLAIAIALLIRMDRTSALSQSKNRIVPPSLEQMTLAHKHSLVLFVQGRRSALASRARRIARTATVSTG